MQKATCSGYMLVLTSSIRSISYKSLWHWNLVTARQRHLTSTVSKRPSIHPKECMSWLKGHGKCFGRATFVEMLSAWIRCQDLEYVFEHDRLRHANLL